MSDTYTDPQQQPGPNDPGGPPPDPKQLNKPLPPANASLNPQALAALIQRAQLTRQYQQQPPPVVGGGTQDGFKVASNEQGNTTTDATAPSPEDPGASGSFVRNTPRPPAQWGKDWWPINAANNYPGVAPGPYMPDVPTSYRTFASDGKLLAMFSPPTMSEPASLFSRIAERISPIMDALSRGGFSRSFNAQHAYQLRMAQERMMDAYGQWSAAHNQMMLAYGDAFERYRLAAAAHPERVPQLTQSLRHEISDLNQQFQFPALDGVLRDSDVWGVEKYLNDMDARGRNLDASASQLKKSGATADTESRREWGEDVGGGDGGISLPGAPGASVDLPGAPAVANKPTPTAPLSDSDKDVLKAVPGASVDELRAAHLFYNQQPIAGFDKAGPSVKTKIGALSRELDARAWNALRNPGQGTGKDGKVTMQDRINAVSKIDPQTGDELKSVLDYRTDVGKMRLAGNFRQKIADMATAIDPKWSEGKFKFVNRWHDQNSHEYLAISAIPRLTQAVQDASVAEKRLYAKYGDAIPFKQQYEQWVARGMTGDDEFSQLFGALQTVAQITSQIASGANVGRVSLIQNTLKEAKPTASMRQLQSQIVADVNLANGVFKQYQKTYTTETGRNTLMPGFFKENVQDLDDILSSNPHNGKVATDAQSRWRALGLAPGEGPKVSDLDDWTPMTKKDRAAFTEEKRQALIDFRDKHMFDPAYKDQVRDAEKALRAASFVNTDPMILKLDLDAPVDSLD
jgi:hypothetical protein